MNLSLLRKTTGLIRELEKRLSPEVWSLVKSAGVSAENDGMALYLVGGAVRDLLLGRPNIDLDLAVEGDAIALAQDLAQREGGAVVVHRRFRTANFHHGDLALDLATARTEVYSHAGALPKISPSSILEDLSRRDFTINAMALCLTPPRLGQLLDPFHGRADLKSGLIRALHPRSFIDDATRILRALRYEKRLGFMLEQNTEETAQQHAAMLGTISGDRLRRELELILKEPRSWAILLRAQELGVLKAMHPALRVDKELAQRFERAHHMAPGEPTSRYLGLLVYPMRTEERASFLRRFRFPSRVASVLQGVEPAQAALSLAGDPTTSPSTIFGALEAVPWESVVAVCAGEGPGYATDRLLECSHHRQAQRSKPALTAADLERLGVPRGPEIGAALRRLRDARLDGLVIDHGQEEALVRSWLEKQ